MRPISEKLIFLRFGVFLPPCKNDFVLIFKAIEADPALSLLFLLLRPCAGDTLLSLWERLEMHVKAGLSVKIDRFTQTRFVCNELLDPSLLLKSLYSRFTFIYHACALH